MEVDDIAATHHHFGALAGLFDRFSAAMRLVA